jgi:hypothetical protein
MKNPPQRKDDPWTPTKPRTSSPTETASGHQNPHRRRTPPPHARTLPLRPPGPPDLRRRQANPKPSSSPSNSGEPSTPDSSTKKASTPPTPSSALA